MSLKSRVSQVLRSRPETDQEGASKPPSAAIGALVVEVGKLVREMLVIPAQLWLALAERLGTATLEAWRRVGRPALALAIAFVGLLYRLALRHLTPARAVAAVALVSIGVLVASQWVDYRGISVGNDAYGGDVGAVAPAPEVAREQAGESHSWVMLPLAAAALAVLALALTGRRRLARLMVPLGIAVIAIALLVDRPNGLDEGGAAVAYQGVSAQLLEGFWLQIAAGVGMIASGLLLPGFLRPEPAATGARRPRQRARCTREPGSVPIGEAHT